MSRHKHGNRINNMSSVNNNPIGQMGQFGQMGGINPLSALGALAGLGNGMGGMQLPFNLPPQISQLLGNIDMNTLGSLFSAISSQGFNLNSLGSLLASNIFGNENGGFNNIPNNIPNNMNFNNSNINQGIFSSSDYDSNISMLQSLRNIVDPQRARFIDRVIEMYQSGEIED